MPDYFEIVERDHALQNPTSAEKIRLLGERLRLGPESRVLDLACGRGGPGLLLAETFGCRVTGVELRRGFLDVARERARAAGLEDRVELVLGDAAEHRAPPESYDVAMCLGATFVWGGLGGTLEALAPAVGGGGHVVVGEPYWRVWPLPDDVADEGYASLADTATRLDRHGLRLVTLIASSEDDWDGYESLHWRAAEEWLEENDADPAAAAIRDRYLAARERYLGWQRALLGWAIFVARKPRA